MCSVQVHILLILTSKDVSYLIGRNAQGYILLYITMVLLPNALETLFTTYGYDMLMPIAWNPLVTHSGFYIYMPIYV